MVRLANQPFDAIVVGSDQVAEALKLGSLLQHERILQGMPDGLVVLDADNLVIWGNERIREWFHRPAVAGEDFYKILGSPDILGPDFSPFRTALATGRASTSKVRTADNRYFQLHAAPVYEAQDRTSHLVVTVRDVTKETLQNQKLAAIHQAGIALTDLKPQDLLDMSVQDRIELLKSNILHYTKDLLKFDVVEIRLLDPQTGKLEPLLEVGMLPEAASRVLYARPQGNGVTGFVAATGKSYLCEDTTQDPLYLQGASGAKSSLTVPLTNNDQVIGTFNVESPNAHAFSESDLQFLEIFTRDLAIALNTLDLLAAEKATSTLASVEAIHSAVALPIDEILNDSVNIMERYIGHDPDVVQRLQRILRHARDIKQVIQKVGQKMAPAKALPQPSRDGGHVLLQGSQVLVVDADESVRVAAHSLLERFGCNVETAHDGAEALCMVRNLGGARYQCIIADIRLPDVSGYDLLCRLKELMDPLPLVLMTGFGYDPGHSIVRARQAGLQAVLYKPFRLDQLLETVERMVQPGEAKG
ncbi:MAG: response regulator [Planctomycetia bacterium]|nr:response regulator [Planctomycetia bacterium]